MTDPQCGARVMVETEAGPRPGTIEEVTVLGEGDERAVFVRVVFDAPLAVCSCGRATCTLDVAGGELLARATVVPEQCHPLH